MKDLFVLMLTVCLLISGAVCAEDVVEFECIEMSEHSAENLDLDGDGSAETVSYRVAEDEENYTEELILEIVSDDGSIAEWRCMIYEASVFVCDIDTDRISEIFVTGDEMSCDYFTVCLQYAAGSLKQLQFADASGYNAGGYADTGYGLIAGIHDGELTLSGAQDILGTYFGSREFRLENGRFEFCDDGIWDFSRYYDLDDPEFWEYCSISPVADIPVTIVSDGIESEGVIAAGEQFVVMGTDNVSVVYFCMPDGRQGWFGFVPDTENWGSIVNGIHETELFEYLPYAG